MMKLRGMFWKPGVNGLGVRGLHCLPYRKRFDVAACAHDRAYDVGGSGADRKRADRSFRGDMLGVCVSGWQRAWANLYYALVRVFGWAFFRYDRAA